MLTREDYEFLKASVKGWDRRRLARYGVNWPPVHGWRTRLLSEFESSQYGSIDKRPKRAKIETDDELEGAFQAEKTLTAKWYQRISGQVAWQPGEREAISIQMEAQAANVNRLIQQKAASDFAALPQEN